MAKKAMAKKRTNGRDVSWPDTEDESGVTDTLLPSTLRGSLARARIAASAEDTARVTLPRMAAVSYVEPDEVRGRHDTPILPSSPAAVGNARAVLIVMTGLEAGRVVTLEGPGLTFGRDPSSDMWVEDPGVSRRHARVGRTADGGFYVEDLGSTNGTFVGVHRVTLAELSSGDHVQLGPSFILRFAITDSTEESLQRQLYESSVRDPLTQVYNRKYLAERLTSEVAHAHRTSGALAVIMIDVDRFKELNDTYGHLAGDKALRHAAAAMARTVRAEDVLARYGGEEFIVLARAADHEEARALAERLRRTVERLRFTTGEADLTITVSVGVASLSEIDPTDGPAALVALADARLYGAKLAGRNRVCSED
jgi:diguanylate cyclase (GGDEF)-like protein